MRYLKICVLLAIPVVFCIAAAPSINPLIGTWAGEGKGWVNPPGTTLHAWQNWKGEITKDGKTFYGEWYDKNGNHGEFKGAVDWTGITTAYAKGEWTWNNPIGIPHVAGKFIMKFSPYSKHCKGTWDSIYPSTGPCKPVMEGKKVD